MSDEESSVNAPDGNLQQTDSEWTPWVGPDQALQLLVDLANNAGLKLDLRLFVAGGVLSGTLISGGEFYESLRTALVKPDSPGAAAMSALISFMASPYDQEEEAAAEDRLTVYVHLDNAWLYSPGQARLEVGSWRGRLSTVEGWAVGSYSTEG